MDKNINTHLSNVFLLAEKTWKITILTKYKNTRTPDINAKHDNVPKIALNINHSFFWYIFSYTFNLNENPVRTNK